jgi:hypothetical protein
VKKAKSNSCWTAFSYVVKSGTSEYHGTLDFLFPKTVDAATREAINKAEFMAAAGDFPFDSNNLTCILSPLCLKN